MNRSRRLLTCILFLCCLLLPLGVLAENNAVSFGEGLSFSVSGGVLTVTGSGAMPDFSDASEQPWYADAASITEVVIESGITRVGSVAFYGLGRLQKVTIPGSVTTIGVCAFSETGFTELTVPGGVEEIELGAFCGCGGLTSLTLEEGVTTIGPMAFHSCVSLREVTLPSTLRSSENTAFDGCMSIERVNISSLAGWCAVSFESPGSNPLHRGGNPIDGGHLYMGGSEVTELIIPEGTTSIGDYAFDNCGALTAVQLPASLTTVGWDAFRSCTKVEAVCFGGTASEYAALGLSFDGAEVLCGMTFDERLKYAETAEAACTYTGSELRPAVTAYDQLGRALPADRLTLTYENNIDVGTASVKVTGFGATYTAYFEILPANMAGAAVTLSPDSFECTGTPLEPVPGVTYLGKVLVNGTDFTLTYAKNRDPGTAVVTLQGKGNFKGTAEKTFTLVHTACLWDEGVMISTLSPSSDEIILYTCLVCSNTKEVKTADAAFARLSEALGGGTLSGGGASVTPGAEQVTFKTEEALGSGAVKFEFDLPKVPGNTVTISAADTRIAGLRITAAGTYDRQSGAVIWSISAPAGTDLENEEAVLNEYLNGAFQRIDALLEQQDPGELTLKDLGLSQVGTGASHHPEVIPAIAPTETENGWTAGSKCSVCGKTLLFPEELPPTLKTPSVTAANGADTGKILLSWQAVPGAKDYTVSRALTAEGGYTVIGTAAELTLTDGSAAAGEKYFYRVTANPSDSSRSPSSACVESPVCDLPMPKVTAGNNAGGNILLTVTKVTGAKGYRIERADSRDGAYETAAEITALTWTDGTAERGKVYYYRVTALHSSSEADSAPGAVVTAACGLLCPTVTLSGDAASGKIVVSITKVAGATGYEIFRSTSAGGTYTPVGTTAALTWTDTGAKAGATYYYKVRAVSPRTGEQNPFSPAVKRCCDLPRPAVTMKHDAATGYNKVTWARVEGAKSYLVYRCDTKEGAYKKLGSTTKLTYTDKTCTLGKKQYYKVMAVHNNSAANSAYSAVKSAIADLPRPVVTGTLRGGYPYLTWAKVPSAEGYTVYRAEAADGTCKKLAETKSRYYRDSTAKKGKTYWYKVVANYKASTGDSAKSAAVKIKRK